MHYVICILLSQRPESDYPTVLDMLDVQDHNILNVLIDQLHVESILLIPRRDEASEVIVGRQARYAACAYTLDGDQVLQHAHSSTKTGKFGILRESVEAAVRDEQAKLDELRHAMDGLRHTADEVDMKVKRDHGSVREASSRVTRRMTEKRKVQAAIEELQNAQEEEEPEEDIATYVSGWGHHEQLLR